VASRKKKKKKISRKTGAIRIGLLCSRGYGGEIEEYLRGKHAGTQNPNPQIGHARPHLRSVIVCARLKYNTGPPR